MRRLKQVLLINGFFSLLSGLSLLLFNGFFTQLFGLASGTVFWIVGGMLVLFGGSVIWESQKLRAVPVLFIIVQDLLWVLGSGILVIARPFDLTAQGYWSIDMVALIVLSFAVFQGIGLAKMDSLPEGKHKSLTYERTVKGSKTKVWKVIADVGNYHEVAPNIDASEIISGSEEGMTRSCTHGKKSWTETCTAWAPESAYTFRVNTQAPDYPFPLTFLQGTWRVEELEGDKCKIIMEFELQYKRKYMNVFVHPLMKSKFGKICDELLDNWQAMIEA